MLTPLASIQGTLSLLAPISAAAGSATAAGIWPECRRMPALSGGQVSARRHASPGKIGSNSTRLDPFCSPRHPQQFAVLPVAIIEYCSTIVFAPNLDRKYDVQAEPIDYRKTAILLDIDGTLL